MRISFLGGGLVLTVATLALAVGLRWVWIDYRRAESRLVRGLEGVRLLLFLLVFFTLARPQVSWKSARKGEGTIAILTDGSGSMATRDIADGPHSYITRQQWLDAQMESRFWSAWQKRSKVTLRSFPADKDKSGTDLNRALEELMAKENNLRAVLLLSDGDWNLGKSPLVAGGEFRDQGIPIFSTAIGRETPLPDLVLQDVEVPSFALLGEEVSISFKVVNRLDHPVKTTLTVQDAAGEKVDKEITVAAHGELRDALLWSPQSPGAQDLQLRLPVEKEEAIKENNEAQAHLNVRVEKLKVLIVDSLPRWEYRYLRNALARDPGIDVDCLLFHPGMGPGEGRQYLSAFPNTKQTLGAYDVIILGDVGVGSNELTSEDAALIRGVVEQQGSGLIFLAGRLGHELTLTDSPLKDLLPVQFEMARPEGYTFENEGNLLLTSAGRHHWLTRFNSDESRNDEIWRQLPGFFWSAPVERSRPGAEVLAVHSTLRNSWGRLPMIVIRPAGSGQVLFMGTDSAWRWRRGVEDRYHYRFWGQVIRWMAHPRHLAQKDGMRLTYLPEAPQSGETVYFQAAVLDQAGLAAGGEGRVALDVTSPSGRRERIDLAAVEGGWGMHKGQWVPTESGKFTAHLSSDNGRDLQADIQVTQATVEKVGNAANVEMLRELAETTGGRFAMSDRFADLVKQMTILPEREPLVRRVQLSNSPWWAGLLLMLMVVYWTGRKLAGMI